MVPPLEDVPATLPLPLGSEGPPAPEEEEEGPGLEGVGVLERSRGMLVEGEGVPRAPSFSSAEREDWERVGKELALRQRGRRGKRSCSCTTHFCLVSKT